MKIDQTVLDQAADWHAAMAGDDPDFEGFTAWLEASPDHVRAYDCVVGLDDRIDAHQPALARALPANDQAAHRAQDDQQRRPRRHFLAAAAAMAMLMPAGLWLSRGGSPVEVASRGAPMEIALDSRTSIALDRNTVLRHAKNDTRQVELAQGAAHFSVSHDPARRFTVTAGDVTVTDLGTKFEIQRNGDQIGIAVAQGSVAVALAGQDGVTLRAGQRAFVERGAIETGPIGSDMIANWRQGQLVYRNAPLSQVAREISRYTPVPVTVDPSLADRRFSGVLTIGDGRTLDKNLADFMGLGAVAHSGAVHIVEQP